VKLVHEVKMEVYSRDEVRHTEKRSAREEAGDGRASVTSEERVYYCQFEER